MKLIEAKQAKEYANTYLPDPILRMAVNAVLDNCPEAKPVAYKLSPTEWIPVTERLPEIVKTTHAWRNVYRQSERVLCACLQANGKRMVKEGYMEFFNDFPEPNWKIPGTIHSVTHWMPLPTPPEGE